MHDRAAQSFDREKASSEHLRLANILDQMPVGIGIFDQHGDLFHANRHFERAAGGAIPSIDAMTSWEAYGQDGTPLETHAYPGTRALMGEVATPGVDFMRVTEAGAQYWLGVSAVPLTVPGSAEPMGAVVVVENIDARRRDEQRRRASEDRFKRFAEHSSNALWIADTASGAIDYMSPAAERIWAACARMDTLADWEANVHPDDRAIALDRRALVQQGIYQRHQYRIIDHKGETVRHVRETSFPIPAQDGATDCIGGIVEDISPDVQIYLVQARTREKSDLLEELRHSAQRITTFASYQDLMNVAEVLNPGCVIVDIRGIATAPETLAQLLRGRPAELQVILIGQQDTPASDVIDALRAGAADYILAPVTRGKLTRAVHAACQALPTRLAPIDEDTHAVSNRLASLPRREREVFLGLVSGGTNKSIARTLELSPRTVEVHRAHLMERLNVRSLTELLHLARDAGIRASF